MVSVVRIITAVAAFLLAVMGNAKQVYKSYGAYCNSSSTEVVFVNFPERDCKGELWNVTNPLNSCEFASLPIVGK